jgi:2-dehydro-3-deoxyphosphooctonate aldolase (KDO 8-P synthase)
VTERGTVFGYGELIVDMRSFERVRSATGAPVFFDGTHSVQRPGRAGGSSGGDPQHVPALVRAATAAGCDGLFLETHPDPVHAPSDGASMLELSALPGLMRSVMALRDALGASSGGIGAGARRTEVSA